VPSGQALLRSGAQAGDDLWVSGTLGDARLALEVFRGAVALRGDQFDTVRRAMELPQPRVALGLALRGVASSAIDLSDGLVGDLAHILARSGVAAVVHADDLPRSAALAAMPLALQQLCVLAGGDDYELLFTASPALRDAVHAAGRHAGVGVTRCGAIEPGAGLRIVDRTGKQLTSKFSGFDHFSA
jgi:thiamine-monophosphate kinase